MYNNHKNRLYSQYDINEQFLFISPFNNNFPFTATSKCVQYNSIGALNRNAKKKNYN